MYRIEISFWALFFENLVLIYVFSKMNMLNEEDVTPLMIQMIFRR